MASKYSAKERDYTGKNTKKGLFPKKVSVVAYAIVMVLAVVARTAQLGTNLNFKTGRYIDPSPYLNYPLAIIVIGIAVLAFLMAAGSAKDKVISSCILINPMRLRYDRLGKKIPVAAAYSFIFTALLTLIQIFVDVGTIVSKNKEIKAGIEDVGEQRDYSLFTGYTAGNAVVNILMFFSVLAFISLAVNIFKKDGLSHANCASLTVVAFWKLSEIVVMWGSTPAVGVKTQQVYEIISSMAVVMFFLMMARFFNGMEKKFTRFWMCMFGYIASILTFASVIPRFVLLLSPASYEDRVYMSIPRISDIGMGFITIAVVCAFWSTYVYRIMPKLRVGGRRWNRAPLSKDYQGMTVLEMDGSEHPETRK